MERVEIGEEKRLEHLWEHGWEFESFQTLKGWSSEQLEQRLEHELNNERDISSKTTCLRLLTH